MQSPAPKYDISSVTYDHLKDPVEFYGCKNAFGCFSNFSAHPITIDNLTWPTTEHYFQAMKFSKSSNLPSSKEAQLMERIRKEPNPAKAKSLGRTKSVQIRDDWNVIKTDIMIEALLAKFHAHDAIRRTLLGTQDAYLVEHTICDREWADGGDGSGKNLLGKCLMLVRQIIRDEISQASENNDKIAQDVVKAKPHEKKTKRDKKKEKREKKKQDLVQNVSHESQESEDESASDAIDQVQHNEETTLATQDAGDNEGDDGESDDDEEIYLTEEQWAAVQHNEHPNTAPQFKSKQKTIRQEKKRRILKKRSPFLDAQGHSIVEREPQSPTTKFMGIRPICIDDVLSEHSDMSTRPTIIIPESALPSQAKIAATKHQFKRRYLNEEEEEEDENTEDILGYDETTGGYNTQDQALSSFLTGTASKVIDDANILSEIRHSESIQQFRESLLQMSSEECANIAQAHAVLLGDILAHRIEQPRYKQIECEDEREKCVILAEVLADRTNVLLSSDMVEDSLVLERVLTVVDLLSPLLSC
jgi:ribA/ribD-fused uncharacterized protein